LHTKTSEAARDRIRDNFRMEDTAVKTMALHREMLGGQRAKRKRPGGRFQI